MGDPRCEVCYLYRDAGNCKFRGRFVVRGDFYLRAVEPFLFDRQWFVPEQIGLPPLRPAVTNDDDHLLHEFEEVLPYRGRERGTPALDLVNRIRRASVEGWFLV